jgi:hypothetical protein
MKKILLTIILAFFFLMNSFSQENTGDQKIYKNGRKYYQFGQKISFSKVKTLLANDPASKDEFKKFKTVNAVSNTFFIVGGVTAIGGAVLYLVSAAGQVATYNHGVITYPKRDYTGGFILVGGMVLELVGAIVSTGARKHLGNSINLFNSKTRTTGMNNIKLNFSTTENGVGLKMRF